MYSQIVHVRQNASLLMILKLNVKRLEILGVPLDYDLSFNSYVSKIFSKCSKLVYLMSKFRRYLNVEQSLRAYTTIVRPIIECFPTLLMGASQKNINTFESIQNRAIRIILSAQRRFSITTGCILLNLSTLASRRDFLFAKFIKNKFLKKKASNLLIQLIESSPTHNRALRFNHNFY